MPQLAKLIYGRNLEVMALELSQELGIAAEPILSSCFPDGESKVHIAGEIEGYSLLILLSLGNPVNDHLMELVLTADAVRAEGAKSVTAILPYMAYARQDRRDSSGDPRSAQVVARIFTAVGIDRLITVDLHTPALESAFSTPLTNLTTEDIFLPAIKSATRDVVVVSPDAGGLKRAQSVAKALGAEMAIALKERTTPKNVSGRKVLGNVRDKACLIIDDMASTGETLSTAAAALRDEGATKLFAVFTHAVMAPGAGEKISEAGFEKIFVSDSIPLPRPDSFTIVKLSPIIADALRRSIKPREKIIP